MYQANTFTASTTQYKLMVKLAADTRRCGSAGYRQRFRRCARDAVAGGSDDGDHGPQPDAVRGSTNYLRECNQEQEARSPRKGHKAMPMGGVDEHQDASDEQSVGLLLKYSPHLAGPKSNAWASAADELAPTNVCGRNAQGLGARFRCLKNAIESSSATADEDDACSGEEIAGNLHRELEHVHDEAMEHEANWKRRLATAERMVEKRLAILTKLT